MTQLKKTYPGLDWFRLVAAVLVVTIHTSPLMDLSAEADFILTRVVARVAVPFFLMASGFFLFKPGGDGRPRADKLLSFVKKTAVLYLAATVLYLPINIYAGVADSWRDIPVLLRDIVFNGTFYHLWYLPAAIIGSVIVWLLLRKLKAGPALAVCLVLYAVGLLGDSYYGLAERVPALSALYGALFKVFDYTRNGLFMAPVFFMLGALLARREPLPLRTSQLGLAVSIPFLLMEGRLLHVFGLQRHDSMYILLPVCMYFMFTTLMHREGKGGKYLRDLSMLVYIVHPALIVVVRGFAGATGLEGLLVDNSMIHFLAVLAGSVAVSLAVAAFFARARVRGTGGGRGATDRAWTEIDLGRLGHNVRALRAALPPGCGIMAVVKADAYGHGAVRLGRHLNGLGVRAFAVAALDEGVRLRRAGVRGEILILGFTPASSAPALRRYRLSQTVTDLTHARELDAYGAPLSVHIKVNTGMNRLGEDAPPASAVASVFGFKNLRVEGLFTHLSVSDGRTAADMDFTERQIRRFEELIAALKAQDIAIPKLHVQSTYGALNYPELRCDYARIGLGIYGVLSRPGDRTVLSPGLKPVLSLKSRVVLVRSVGAGESVSYGRDFVAAKASRIAVVSVGFADGIPRTLSSGRGAALIRGRRVPIAGRVCMDQLMLDVTDVPDVQRGDVVTLIGKDGAQELRAEQVADAAGTITNELLSRLGARLGRVYLND